MAGRENGTLETRAVSITLASESEMELFRDTNFDFLKWKWPFVGASLVLTAIGLASWIGKGGLSYGIDFKGGAEMRVRFQSEPPVDRIRTELAQKIKGEISVQPIVGSGAPELLIGTELTNETELNANRDLIQQTLSTMFGGGEGKLDLNNLSGEELANSLRGKSGIPTAEEDLQKIVTGIRDLRVAKGGLVKSLDELSGVPGVNADALAAIKGVGTAGQFAIQSTDVVGPKIGAELKQKAVLATLYSLGAMLIYIAFRFEWIYGLAAVIAVFHDTIITLGLFSLTNRQISLTVVAALLTLVGYSMNDTIVVFDRIRENIKLGKRGTMTDLINMSINQTLSRTILTSGLTFLTALALWIFGGDVLEGFSFALVVGILVGTYSSIFVASPILVFWQDMMAKRNPAAAAAANARAANPAKSVSIEKPVTAAVKSPEAGGQKKKVVRR
jgi:preprotein translocase subunit SecF